MIDKENTMDESEDKNDQKLCSSLKNSKCGRSSLQWQNCAFVIRTSLWQVAQGSPVSHGNLPQRSHGSADLNHSDDTISSLGNWDVSFDCPAS